MRRDLAASDPRPLQTDRDRSQDRPERAFQTVPCVASPPTASRMFWAAMHRSNSIIHGMRPLGMTSRGEKNGRITASVGHHARRANS